MSWSPYRRSAAPAAGTVSRKSPMGNRDIAPVFVAVWLISLVRLLVGLIRGETFGTELTLVVVAIALLPRLLASSGRPPRS